MHPLLSMLGEGRSTYADPQAWRRLEEELGAALPGDFKKIIDLYGPVQLNGHLFLHHPASERWNLGERIKSSSEAFSEVPWGEIEFEGDGDPRGSLGIRELEFGTAAGLVPAIGNDRGEEVFLAKGAVREKWRVFIMRDDEWYEFDMDFSEWLYRYLIGEDVMGSNSAAFYPGPVKFESLPMRYEERSVAWYGPDRGF
ncbi:hypothetical protein GCM10022245_15560 [Streptomyces mayteni]